MTQPRIVFSVHAVARYQQRVRAVTTRQAGRELRRLTESGTLVSTPPNWHRSAAVVPPADGYLMLTDDLVLPLVRQPDGALLAVSLLARAALSDEARKGRNEHKADERARKRTIKFTARGGRHGRRPRPEPDAGDWS